jgi:CTP synthase
VNKEAVIESIDVSTIYEVPIKMKEEKLDEIVLKKLGLPLGVAPDLKKWNEFLLRYKNPKKEVKIALIGKYVELHDAYKSICEALIHSGAANECRVKIEWIHSEKINEENIERKVKDCDGIIIAPGFGHRGIEGKIVAAKYARENNIPFFGICLGMQIAVIEFARNVLKFSDADSTEMNESTKHPVIDLMEEQKEITDKGGTMRLGAYACQLKKDSKVYDAYGKPKIMERHRHRYEFNDTYLKNFEDAGMKAVGINPETKLVEVVEIPNHPWFVGVQFHPEYSSTVLQPHPLFVAFIKAVLEHSK